MEIKIMFLDVENLYNCQLNRYIYWNLKVETIYSATVRWTTTALIDIFEKFLK